MSQAFRLCLFLKEIVMSLTKRTKDILVVAMADKKAANELSAAVDAGGNAQAAAVAALGATADLSAAAAAVTTGGTPDCDAAAVEAGINAAVDALAGEVEARLDASEAKIDAIIAALKAAGLMAS